MPPTYIKLFNGPLALGIVFLLTVLAVASITSFITGYRPRDYLTLSSSIVVKIAGQPVLIEQLAHDFKPLLFLAPENISPPAVEMWWEAIDTGDSIALVYHPVWQDERHPVPALGYIYSIYRAIVYGIPLRDIEYIQINVAYSDGRISRVRYEGSSSTFYYSCFTTAG